MTAWVPARIGSAAAILGAGAIAVGSVVTAVPYSGAAGEAYSPLNHWVSELGQPGVSDLALVFDVSLIVGGICFAVLMLGLLGAVPGRLRFAFAPIGVVAGLGGMFVGIFPMNISPQHGLAAMTFFNLGWIAVGLASIAILLRRDPRFPRWLALVGAMTVACFIAFLVALRVDPILTIGQLGAPAVRPALWVVAALEWAVIVGILAWTFLVGLCWRRGLRSGETS
ncbi:MAG: DUF998 domain-containing protein [Candidatus Limnocylindrales bacterium]